MTLQVWMEPEYADKSMLFSFFPTRRPAHIARKHSLKHFSRWKTSTCLLSEDLCQEIHGTHFQRSPSYIYIYTLIYIYIFFLHKHWYCKPCKTLLGDKLNKSVTKKGSKLKLDSWNLSFADFHREKHHNVPYIWSLKIQTARPEKLYGPFLSSTWSYFS